MNVASILYRGLYPAAHLRRAGHETLVFDFPLSFWTMRTLDALVIVKAMNNRAYLTALNARALGVPVILDICDDIFVPGYGKGDGAEAQVFRAMAALASAIVTTGPAMLDLLRREIGPNANILIVEDPIETAEDNTIVNAAITQWRRQTMFERFMAKVLGTFAAMVRKVRRIEKVILRLIKRVLNIPARVFHVLAVATHKPRHALAAMLRGSGRGGERDPAAKGEVQSGSESGDASNPR
jgi:hypothetical protein